MKKSNQKQITDWYNNNANYYENRSKDRVNFSEIEEFCSYLPKGGKVLDAGCGFGRDTKVFFDKGHKSTGIDLSSGLLKIAKEKYPEINFVKGNLLRLPFENESFDGIWAHSSLVHVEKNSQIKKILDEFNRVLKPGSILHVTVKAKGSTEKEGETRFFRYDEPNDWHVFLEMSGFFVEKIYLENGKNIDHKRNVVWVVVLGKKM
jgi:ubiquinone/menaquinone biosynthesis C-methylase UbiE